MGNRTAIAIAALCLLLVSCGSDDYEDLCEDLVDRMEECLPQIEDEMCSGSGYATCYVYLKDDPVDRCTDGLEEASDQGVSDDEIEEVIEEALDMSCTKLASEVAPYISRTYTSLTLEGAEIEQDDSKVFIVDPNYLITSILEE